MQFIHHDLGYRQAGEIVEVTLSAAANVRLMDSSNFSSYQNGRQHRYHGGLVTRSPVHLQIPHSGTWYVTVDMQGLSGSVRSAVLVKHLSRRSHPLFTAIRRRVSFLSLHPASMTFSSRTPRG